MKTDNRQLAEQTKEVVFVFQGRLWRVTGYEGMPGGRMVELFIAENAKRRSHWRVVRHHLRIADVLRGLKKYEQSRHSELAA